MKKIFLLFTFFAGFISLESEAQNMVKPSVILADTSLIKPRMRVIIDNDFSGDPDGLFQLAQQVLSPSVEISAIIGSHLKKGDGFDPSDSTASHAVAKAKQLLTVMGMENRFQIYEGSNKGMTDAHTPVRSAAAAAIVKEAMRTDTSLPLFVVCGAGLTDLASAYLMEPKIADKLTLIWIGGPEYAGLSVAPPGSKGPEYNLAIDIRAGQTVFNQSAIPVWQIPRNAYRQALLSYAELVQQIGTKGKTGAYLTAEIERIMKMTLKFNLKIGETYILGDSPLVLLTALQSSFEADPSSSEYAVRKSPLIADNGAYALNKSGRNIRVYTKLDIRLMFEDLFAKLQLLSQKEAVTK